ncbi:MAG: Signal recognition particle 54 kDa protein [Pseudomonadota bacterium]|jgi:flagellar biosynthesis GTPase FlhF
MELKRILARDSRSATEQALARFGPNVFVISNQRLAGQTELVVAVDVQAAQSHEEELVATAQATASAGGNFETNLRVAKSAVGLEPEFAPEASFTPMPSTPPPTSTPTPSASAENDRDWIRSREIVATVREEIAALRQEFRLSQKSQLWQSEQNWPEAIAPLVQGLQEAAVPASLRTLLLDGLREQSHLGAAIDTITQQLVFNLPDLRSPAPASGIHVLAGSSGSGKTTMAARLVQRAQQDIPAEQMAVIAFKDQRAGAWQQTQMLCAQSGVDCYRAKDSETLALLLAELSERRLILIDTPGVQLKENLSELQRLCPAASWHAVLPADASSVTLQRVLGANSLAWASLMVSKLDESSAPWPLLHYLMQAAKPIPLSVASGSEQVNDGLTELTPAMLADLAVAQWVPPVQSAFADVANWAARWNEVQALHG